MSHIAMIPADGKGNKLFIKDFREDEVEGRYYVKYKSTFNDVPFIEVELNLADEGRNVTINGDDGSVLYRFSTYYIAQIVKDDEGDKHSETPEEVNN